MKPAHIPRYLPPPQGVSASECAWRIRCAPRPRCRNASTGLAPSKPRVLEKPAKFRPPSHPQRLVKQRTPRQYPGPPLSEVQRAEQRIKRYPNMMPAEGTFMFWFLNSRLLHMGITLVLIWFILNFVLFSLSNSSDRVCSSLLLPLYLWKTSTDRLHLWTCYPPAGSSGPILSNSLPLMDMCTNFIRTTSVLKLPRGGRRKQTMSKKEADTAKLTVWKTSKVLVDGLQKVTLNYWALLYLVKTSRVK